MLKQHINGQYTIALPLIKDNHTDYLVIEYKGDEYQRFQHLVRHLFKTLKIENYAIYQGKDAQRIQVFIAVEHISLEEADARLQYYSDALKEKMTKKWKTLPSINLPEAYNIITLPYSHL